MDLKLLRRGAFKYFLAHKQARNTYLDSWRDWKKARGDSTTEQILFTEDLRAKGLIEDEQMYCRFAMMYTLMAIMEMMYQAQEGESREE